MKTNIIFLISLFSLFVSCNIEQESYHSPNKPKETLFNEAKEMKGIEKFIIGKTSIKEINRFNEEIKKDKRYGEYYMGTWIGEEFKEKESWTSCDQVKQYSISKYFVGEIEIQYLDLYFYNGILYEINSWTSGSLEEAFTKKYGEGIKDYSRYESGSKENRKFRTRTFITWENENIIAHYDDSFDNFEKNYKRTNRFEISTKDNKILTSIRDCSNAEYERKKKEEELKKSESINKI